MVLLRQKERNDLITQLYEAEGRYRSLFENNHAAMLIIQPEDGKIVDANPTASDFYGWSPAQLKSMRIAQINVLSEEETDANLQDALDQKRNLFIFKHRKASGDLADVEIFSGPIKIDNTVYLYSIIHDVSQRVAYEKALAESEARFRLLVESAPDAIYIQADLKFVFLNHMAVTLFGAESAEELIGKSIMDRIHPDFHELVTERIAIQIGERKAVPTVEEIYIKVDEAPFDVEVTASPIRYENVDATVVFVRDISGRKALQRMKDDMEAQLRQKQKLEAIGTLAGGVAHEINNPISGIMNYAELILDQIEESSSAAEYAREIVHETERISEIVKNLLQFSRQEKQTHSYASVYDIVNRTVSLINTIIRKDQIQLNIDMEEDLPEIKCRNQQIQQVLMNLLTNARDALNEKYPGYHEDKVICIRCSLFHSEGRNWIRLTVEDHGRGIAKLAREKIFEPFFSTKPKEAGTGLGLSISFGIVEDHHGRIMVDTREGEYAKFSVELPVDNGWELSK
jgi:PAS domain S-box-containing protein